MDAVVRFIAVCCFLSTGILLVRASEDDASGRRNHGDGPPERQRTPGVHLVGEGQPATFTCSAVSSVAMTVSWTHNGTVLQGAQGAREATGVAGNFTVTTSHEPWKSSRGGSSQTLTRSKLRLHRVTFGDAGVYSCEFGDHSGVVNQSSRLIVKPVNVVHDAGENCLEGGRCLGAHTVCNASSLRCHCMPGYSTSQRDRPECVPDNSLHMGQDQGQECNSSSPCSAAQTECSRTGRCECVAGTVWRNGSCLVDRFQTVSWLIWVGASAAVIAAILVAAKVTTHILRKRNYRRGNLLSVNEDSIASDEDGNGSGDRIQAAPADNRDRHTASTN